MSVKVGVSVYVRVSVFVDWRAFESYVMTKGGESVISGVFFSVCWSDQCVISHSPSPPNKMDTRVHKDTLAARKKAFSLQLIAALHSPVIKLFTALWPHCTCTHTDLCTHARVCTSLSSECVRAGLLQLSGGRLGWGL